MTNFGHFRKAVIFRILAIFWSRFLHKTILVWPCCKGDSLGRVASFATFWKLCYFCDESSFFPTVFWHRATLTLFLIFCLLFSICFAMYRKKKRQRFYIWAPWCCRPVCFLINTMRASTYNSPLSHGGHIVPGDQKELCFTTLSLAMETMEMRLKQSFFGPPGQYGRLVTRANMEIKLLE